MEPGALTASRRTTMTISRRTLLAGAAAAPLGLLAAPAEAAPAFGLTNSGGYFTVSTGAGLVFKVKQSGGDLTSLNYNGVELQPTGTNGSHVESGLGSTAKVTASQ